MSQTTIYVICASRGTFSEFDDCNYTEWRVGYCLTEEEAKAFVEAANKNIGEAGRREDGSFVPPTMTKLMRPGCPESYGEHRWPERVRFDACELILPDALEGE